MYGTTATARRRQEGMPVTDRSGRAIGRLIGRRYHKRVTRPDQILRSPPGFGFDCWAMDTYVLSRVDEIVVEDQVNGKVYRISPDEFRQRRLSINRGAGPQYVVPMSYWTAEEAPAKPRRARPTPAAAVAEPEQTGQARLV